MARDKHKSPVEVTYRKQFEPAHLALGSPAQPSLYGCNLKPSSPDSQLELDLQVTGGGGGRPHAASGALCSLFKHSR